MTDSDGPNNHLYAASLREIKSAEIARGNLNRLLLLPIAQLFSRYPVLKIHATVARQIAKNPKVIAKLTSTLTSDVP